MTKPELIEKLKSLEEESPCNWNAALSAAIYYIDKLEPTINKSELIEEIKKSCKEYSTKEITHMILDGCDNEIDHQYGWNACAEFVIDLLDDMEENNEQI